MATPAEADLPALSEDAEAARAQMAERAYWMNHTIEVQASARRLCRARDEAVAVMGRHNQIVRQED